MTKEPHSNAYNAAKLPVELTKDYDVIVIGSGAGGASSAEIFATSGLRVLILEEGPYRTHKDFTLHEADAYPDLYQEVAARKTVSKGVTILQGRTVGGSTTVNWTSSFRTPNQVLEHWQREFGLKQLTTTELNPWFNQIEQDLSVAPWAIPPNANNSVLQTGCDALGYSSKIIPRNVKGCANLGYCGMGCPINAKQSMLVTAIPNALDAGAKIISRARAHRLLFKGSKIQAVEVQALDDTGRAISNYQPIKFKAKHFVLSAGAIGSPSILLRSKIPDPNNLIGKRTFLHPTIGSAALMPQIVDGFQGAPQSVYSDEFLWRDGVQGEVGYKLEIPPIHPLLSSTLMPGFGPEHRDLMNQFRHFQVIIALLRDGFNPEDNGGEVQLNSDGYPMLDYQLSKPFWRAARHSMAAMAEIQFAAGAKQVMPVHQQGSLAYNFKSYQQKLLKLPFEALQLNIFSAHVMGGCAMGSEPDNAVVDDLGNAYQMENLSVIDGSMLPTSLGVNPQLTLYALARRCATNLVKVI